MARRTDDRTKSGPRVYFLVSGEEMARLKGESPQAQSLGPLARLDCKPAPDPKPRSGYGPGQRRGDPLNGFFLDRYVY